MGNFKTRIKIRHLKTVITIAEMGNLLKAAQRMSVSQSAISKSLAEAEELAGGELFDRTPYGAKPTQLGLSVIHHGRVILGDLERADDELASVLRGESGTLSIGLFSLIASWDVATRALLDFARDEPQVALTVEDGKMDDLIAKLEAGTLDVIVGRYPFASQQPQHAMQGLCMDGIVLATRKGHPLASQKAVTLAQLAPYPWIVPPAGNLVLTQLELIVKAEGTALANKAFSSLSMPLNLAVIHRTDAIMLMPLSTAQSLQRPNDVHVLPLQLGLSMGPIVAMWHTDRPPSRHRERFVAGLAALAKQRDGH